MTSVVPNKKRVHKSWIYTLIDAIRDRDTEDVLEMFAKLKIPAERKLIMKLVDRGDIESVKYLGKLELINPKDTRYTNLCSKKLNGADLIRRLQSGDIKYSFSARILETCIKRGDSELFKIYIKNVELLPPKIDERLARNGRVRMLAELQKHIEDTSGDDPGDSIDSDKRILIAAIKTNRLEIVDYVFEYDHKLTTKDLQDALYLTVRFGFIGILDSIMLALKTRLISSQDIFTETVTEVFNNAIKYGKVDVMNYIGKMYDMKVTGEHIAIAKQANQQEIVDILTQSSSSQV